MGAKDQRHDLTGAVKAVLDQEVGPAATVVAGVSGGPDSVALLRLVAAARPDLRIVVGHVRHGLRDDSADAAAARAAARTVGAEWAERPVDASTGPGEGPEDRARRARLDALVELAGEVGAAAVLLGHTADDQAETVLLRIARGTGPDGLAGMRPRSLRGGMALIRPLLDLRRTAVRGVLARGESVTDPTNADPDQRRARARRAALPALGRLRPDGGDAVPALAALARLAAADVDLLEHLLGPHWPTRFGMAVVVALPAPDQAPPHVGAALGARLLRAGWRLLPDQPRPPSRSSLGAVLRLLPGERVDVGGGVGVDRVDGGWVLRSTAWPRLPELELVPSEPLRVPGHDLVYRLREPFPEPLVVRSRPAGLPEEVKVLLRRHAPPLRDQVPLVCAADGTVLMVGTEPVRSAREGRHLPIDATGGLRPVYPEAP